MNTLSSLNDKLNAIATLSRTYGSDANFVFLGGGNTSVKQDGRLYIKPSGAALATIQPQQFLCVDRTALASLFTMTMPSDITEREAVAKRCLESSVRPLGAGRPSVETPVHHVIDYTYVVHLHPALVNGMTCAKDGEAACRRLFPDALWLPYTDPGSTLSFHVKAALDSATRSRGAQPHVVFLQNHGVFVGADSPDDIIALYDAMMKTLQEAYSSAGISTEDVVIPPADTVTAAALSEEMKRLLPADGGDSVLLCLGNGRPFSGPLSPDHVVYAKSFAYIGDGTAESLNAFHADHGYWPHVVCIKGKGLFAIGNTAKDADGVRQALLNALLVERLSCAFGGSHYLNKRQYGFIEDWEVESYRRSVSTSHAAV